MMSCTPRVCAPVAGLAALLVTLLWSVVASAQSNPALVVVFDGSGSMWGRLGLGPQSKLAVAREALAETFQRSAVHVPTGLVSFGRRRGDCSDVELIAPVEAGDRQRILAPLERLSPRGRGPLTLALRTAAKSLEGHDGPRHILVIHDEPDNCSLDPCATAAELEAADPRLAVSTVTLGAPPDDVRLMACLATATGGRAFAADTPQDAKSAIDAAIQFAMLDDRPGARQALVAAPRQASRPGGPPRARLSARLGPTGPALASGLEWRIWPASGRDGPTIAESKQAQPDIALEPGRYVVEARAGLARQSAEFDVAGSGVTPLRLDLDAGRVEPNVVFRRGEGSDPNAKIALFSATEASSASKTALWIGRPEPLVVPPGAYTVVAADGRSRSERTITVTAGSTIPVELSLDAGRIALSAVARDAGMALDGVTYRILEADPEAAGGFREVARTAASTPEFVLPAGSYQVIARQGTAEIRTRLVVAAGETVRHTFALPVARVVARATMAGGATADDAQFAIRLSPLDGTTGDTIETARGDAVFFVPPGRYRLEARAGSLDAVATRDLDLRSGVEETVALTVPAARVDLRVGEPVAGLALAETFWEILDSRNRVIWRTVEQRPSGILAEGRYLARLTLRTRRFEASFNVKSGVPITVTLGDERSP